MSDEATIKKMIRDHFDMAHKGKDRWFNRLEDGEFKAAKLKEWIDQAYEYSKRHCDFCGYDFNSYMSDNIAELSVPYDDGDDAHEEQFRRVFPYVINIFSSERAISSERATCDAGEMVSREEFDWLRANVSDDGWLTWANYIGFKDKAEAAMFKLKWL